LQRFILTPIRVYHITVVSLVRYLEDVLRNRMEETFQICATPHEVLRRTVVQHQKYECVRDTLALAQRTLLDLFVTPHFAISPPQGIFCALPKELSGFTK
jgi:hypothetical protein